MLNEHKGKKTLPKNLIKLIMQSQSYQMKWILNKNKVIYRLNIIIIHKINMDTDCISLIKNLLIFIKSKNISFLFNSI